MELGDGADRVALHEAISVRAYAIWEREGRPHNNDWEHWFKAESEVLKSTAARQTRANSKQALRAKLPQVKKTKAKQRSGRKKRKGDGSSNSRLPKR